MPKLMEKREPEIIQAVVTQCEANYRMASSRKHCRAVKIRARQMFFGYEYNTVFSQQLNGAPWPMLTACQFRELVKPSFIKFERG